ncbi:GNAT family N-acetyltransferase [Hymenobacter sp.]|uniref:GNAT family N-acetyltransferase n=1 Tax=Hymenobacter sp. TaxID=1898978 RepID=UPI00286A756F|nr:GNAT family N-acetyltransferase [Hymenobacter sp.]
MQIVPYTAHHLGAVIQLSLQAWAPVFASLRKAMSPGIYHEMYPGADWQKSQQQAVESVCADPAAHVWIATEADSTAGFVAVKLHAESNTGEIYMVAVAPELQNRGIGGALTEFALRWMGGAGMSLALVKTGGDPGPAPARRTYEKAGFELLPIARYFRKL